MNIEDKKCKDINFEDYYKYEMKCFECSRSGIKNKIFYDELKYQHHHIEHHETRKNDKKNKLICSECFKESQSWYNYAAHITTHRDHCSPPWICQMIKNANKICGKRCSTRHNLIKHMEGYHRYNVKYKKKNPVQYKKKLKSMKLMKSLTNNTNNTKPEKPKKLRPKMKFIPSPKITSKKRSINDINNINNINEPKYKRQRIDEQARFLSLMYKAAMEENKNMDIIKLPQIDYQPIITQNNSHHQQQQQQHIFIPMIQHQFPLNPAFSPITLPSSVSPVSPDF